MRKTISLASALLLGTAIAASAQTSTTPAQPSMPVPGATVPAPTTSPATASTMSMSKSGDVVLSDADAKTWVDKVVYSSDNKNVGEVAAFARDSAGKITEMHADIGGFLGLGETRVRLTPSQFKFDTDKVVLAITADEAKNLPRIVKQ